jgi:hypothetical protein
MWDASVESIGTLDASANDLGLPVTLDASANDLGLPVTIDASANDLRLLPARPTAPPGAHRCATLRRRAP